MCLSLFEGRDQDLLLVVVYSPISNLPGKRHRQYNGIIVQLHMNNLNDSRGLLPLFISTLTFYLQETKACSNLIGQCYSDIQTSILFESLDFSMNWLLA